MPELPEVETLRRSLESILLGRCIEQVSIRETRLRTPVSRRSLGALRGAEFVALRRRSKYLLIDLRCASGERTLIIHLGMSGSLRRAARGESLHPHDHVVFHLASGDDLRYRDARRFGSIVAVATRQVAAHPSLARLGPEPFDPSFDGAYLASIARGRRTSAKAFVMDQRIVAGVGNIYACEALYRARISPRRRAGTIGAARAERLAAAVRDVLGAAIEAGGTTLQDYVDGEGREGSFGSALSVYGRAGDACDRCGAPIKSIVQSARTTYYCGGCQR